MYLVSMNRDINPSNYGPSNMLGNGNFPLGRAQIIHRPNFVPNSNANAPRLPGLIPFNNFVLTTAVPRATVAPRVRDSQPRFDEACFKPRQIISAKEFAVFAMSQLKNTPANLALQFLQLRKVEAEVTISKAVNEGLCARDLLGIYSESPFLRPVLLLRQVLFATPTSTMYQFPDPENMVRQLKDLADQKVASMPLVGMISGLKPSALSLGFSTDYLMHVFNVELDLNLIAFLNEHAKEGITGDKYRVVLRLGWATQGLRVSPVSDASSTVRLLAAEALPRCLQIRVARRPVILPEPIFHAGQAVKLGHRLNYSIDITDKVPLRAANLVRSRNIEIEITWLHAPLEDHAQPLLESISDGVLTPIVNQVITMPLVQVTLDRVESLPKIVRNFALAVAGRPADELFVHPAHPPPINGFSLPPFTPSRLLGVYDFCESSERVISVERTLEMLKKKMSVQDDLLCDDWIPVTLLCPLTLTRIEIPVRSVNCDHLQCFDLASYLTINKRRPRWNCPVCSLPAPFRDLRRDDFFLQLLMDKSLAGAEHVKVDSEGNHQKVLSELTSTAVGRGDHDYSLKSNVVDDRANGEIGSKVVPPPCPPSPSQRAHPSSSCIIVIDDSDSQDSEDNTNGEGRGLPVVTLPQSTLSAPTPPIPTFTASASNAFPLVPSAVSSDIIVDLTELSDDNEEYGAASSQTSSSLATVPLPVPPPPSPPPAFAQSTSTVDSAVPPSPSPILFIPAETKSPSVTPAVVSATGQLATLSPNLQARRFAPFTVSGGRIILLSSASSNSTTTILSPGVQTAEATTSPTCAAAVTYSNPANLMPLPAAVVAPSNSNQDPTTSRLTRFKITAKRRCLATPPTSTAVSPHLVLSPPVTATTTFDPPTNLTSIASPPTTTPFHRLRSSRQAIPPPQPPPRRRLSRTRRRVFIDDNSSDPTTPSTNGGAAFEPSISPTSAEGTAEDEEVDDDDDSDDDWTPVAYTSGSAPSASARRRSAVIGQTSRRKSSNLENSYRSRRG